LRSRSTTHEQAVCGVAVLPAVAGSLPATARPVFSATRAVVKPSPAGQGPGKLWALICANRLTVPLGEICTIVVPVPCRLALLLKLLTRMLPRVSEPAVVGTTATP